MRARNARAGDFDAEALGTAVLVAEMEGVSDGLGVELKVPEGDACAVRVTQGVAELETDEVPDLEAVIVEEPVKDAVPEFVRVGVGDSLGDAVLLPVT